MFPHIGILYRKIIQLNSAKKKNPKRGQRDFLIIERKLRRFFFLQLHAQLAEFPFNFFDVLLNVALTRAKESLLYFA
jgi:hypothetical protein